MLLTYSVTLAVWQSCSLACRHVIEERKCLGATPFQDFPTCSRRCRHVITLLLGKMSWFFYDFRVILVSQTLASQRDRSSELLCVFQAFLFSTKSNINKGPRYEGSLAHTKIALRSSLMDEIMDYFAFCIQGH